MRKPYTTTFDYALRGLKKGMAWMYDDEEWIKKNRYIVERDGRIVTGRSKPQREYYPQTDHLLGDKWMVAPTKNNIHD